MEYFLSCECGGGVTVPEAAAGTTVLCACGRRVTVPSFRELRERSGQPKPKPPPELVIEALLLAGQLPEESACVLCAAVTDHTVLYRTICERGEVDTGDRPWWQILLASLTFGLLGGLIFAASRQPERELGRDRVFSLPLRICPGCSLELTTEDAIKDALALVPVYRRLLEKYPDAEVEALPR